MRAAGPAALAGALLLFACAKSTTVQTHHAQPSGFLGDYSALEPGRGDQAALLYIDPAADFAGYHSVAIDPVTIWRGAGTEKVPEAELQALANYLHASLRQNLSQSFKVAEQPGPGTLRIRTAITEARGVNVPLNVASTVLPLSRLMSEVKNLATGTQAFVGRAAIEVEVLDGADNSRLVAAVDERTGTKTLRGAGGTWGDVKEAFDAWAQLIAVRLAFFRALDSEQAEGVEADTIGSEF
jgi:hypothetical protein